ncbi:MAG: tRNA (guanosine(46)-N7)-methyltransferase TrmB [Pseudomonadales bacterium]|nr:tRNA (guanosine(46)-N7)-methyltransferase TrmB [Pseudomonadales bacterium]
MNLEQPLRRIQTFVRRSSPLTSSQRQGLDLYAGRFRTLPGTRLDSPTLFNNHNPLTVEIGFGMGQSLVAMARAAPERNFLGIEVHEPGLAQIFFDAGERQLDNLKILEGDALDLLSTYAPQNSIDRLQLYFPDPWPKKRHHKRRLVSTENAALIHSKLCVGGVFHMATDWEPYAQWMLDVMSTAAGYRNMAGEGQFHSRPDYRPLTKFEQRGLRDGHGIWDLLFARTPD